MAYGENRAPDNRGWVLNPEAHRAAADAQQDPQRKTGDEIMTPFGKATLFVMPSPDDLSLWYCDLCNQQILTKWGDEPFPVAMIGNSHALCNDCRIDFEGSNASDIHGEPMDELEGLWPFRLCRCNGCFITGVEWRPYIEGVIEEIKAAIANQN